MKYKILNNGVKMPILGLGVYQIWDQKQCEETVINAINNGYRLIDTAEMYANEEAVGNAIKKSGVDRKELFITTKVWIPDDYYHYYERVLEVVQNSLRKLQTEYIDLVLIHNSYGDYHSAWRALEYLYEKGVVKAIGVSNFMSDKLVDLCLTSKIKPMVNQIEMNPFYQRHDDQVWADKYNVALESWASFGEANPELFNNKVLKRIAEQHIKTVPQIILRWLIQRDVIVIPKSVHENRLIENMNVFDFTLSEKEMEEIKNIDTKKPIFFDMHDPDAVEKLIGFRKWLEKNGR